MWSVRLPHDPNVRPKGGHLAAVFHDLGKDGRRDRLVPVADRHRRVRMNLDQQAVAARGHGGIAHRGDERRSRAMAGIDYDGKMRPFVQVGNRRQRQREPRVRLNVRNPVLARITCSFP